MKKNKNLIKLLVFLMLAFSYSAYSQEVTKSFKIFQTVHYGEQVLQVSAPSSSNNLQGTIQLFDSKQKMVKEIKDIEIIKAPFFTTISIEELPAGTYNIKIITSTTDYSQSIFIKK
jgi:hypothetical protein